VTSSEDRTKYSTAQEKFEEEYLHEILAMLREQYAKAVQPYIDRLVQIQAMRASAPMIVSVDQARQLGLLPPDMTTTVSDHSEPVQKEPAGE
jgi:hypothetical protein